MTISILYSSQWLSNLFRLALLVKQGGTRALPISLGEERMLAAGANRTVCVVSCSRIKLFLDVLMKEILHPESQSPNGVKFHFIDIYLDELSKVGGKEVRSGQTPCGSVTWPQLPRTGRALALP